MKKALSVLLFIFLFGVNVFAAEAPPQSCDPNIFVSLSKKLVPSVVNISTVSIVKSPYGRGGPEEFFRRFFEDFFRQAPNAPREDDDEAPRGKPGPQNMPRAMALGTGFIIDASGLILTNNHVVAEADEIKIQFTEEAEEKPTDGEVVGRDPELDLALIKVKSKREMTPVVFGDSDALEVGEYVVAIGNPFGQGHSVTHGIISAKERKAPDLVILSNYLQTDAPINPGNSGGPLVNMKGEVIGINNAIDQRAQGIGFAIPINIVKNVLPQLKTKGSVSRGYIGVLVADLTPEVSKKLSVSEDIRAPFVTNVYENTPATRAGIKPYDVILQFNGKTIHSSADLVGAVTSVPVNDTVPISVLRAGKEIKLNIKVAQRESPQQMAKKSSKQKKKDNRSENIKTGMELEDLTSELAKDLGVKDKSKGAVVNSIAYDGPADKAGLLRGDIILEVDMKPIKNVDSFYDLVKEKKSYLLRIRRISPQGGEGFLVLTLDLKEGS